MSYLTNIVRLKGADKPQLVDIDDVGPMYDEGLIEAFYDEDFNEITREEAQGGGKAQDQNSAQQEGSVHPEG